MEDAATAEISRTQVWQWLHNHVSLADGRIVNIALFREIFAEEMQRIRDEVGDDRFENGKFELAARLFQQIIEQEQLEEFLTLAAYRTWIKTLFASSHERRIASTFLHTQHSIFA